MGVIRPKKSVGRRKKTATKRKPVTEAKKKTSPRRTKRGSSTTNKPPIFSQKVMLKHLNQNLLPAMVNHCIIKVYKKVKGGKRAKFYAAYNICLATFQKYGYMQEKSLRRTAKGMKRNRKHQRESARGRKRRVYETMVTSIWGKELEKLKEQNRQQRAQRRRRSR